MTRRLASAAVGVMAMLALGPVGAQTPAAANSNQGKPDLSGIWQAMNTANWNLAAHVASAGADAVSKSEIKVAKQRFEYI